MSDKITETLTPETPSYATQMQDKARRLEATLLETAGKLGLKLSVRYDPVHWCFRIFARLKVDPVTYDIDEQTEFRGPGGSSAFADLLTRILEDVQLTLHNKVAEAMTAVDVLQRSFGLSKDDKETLHDMFMDAHEKRASYDLHRLAQNKEKLDAYEALIGRLFR